MPKSNGGMVGGEARDSWSEQAGPVDFSFESWAEGNLDSPSGALVSLVLEENLDHPFGVLVSLVLARRQV
jgi:hypothetical protein